MIIEAGVASSPDIVLCAVRSQCHAGEMLPAFCFTNHLAPAAIRQSQVTHNRVEVLRSQECKRAFHIVRCGNGMTEMPEQAGQDAAGIAVILDHQYLQGHNSGKKSRPREPRLVTTIEMAVPVGCFERRKFYLCLLRRWAPWKVVRPLTLTYADAKNRDQHDEKDIRKPDQQVVMN